MIVFGISRQPEEEPTNGVGPPERNSEGTQPMDERERVVRFRFSRLVSVGYDSGLATWLAEDLTVDWHRAVELLTAGCDTKNAAAILL